MKALHCAHTHLLREMGLEEIRMEGFQVKKKKKNGSCTRTIKLEGKITSEVCTTGSYSCFGKPAPFFVRMQKTTKTPPPSFPPHPFYVTAIRWGTLFTCFPPPLRSIETKKIPLFGVFKKETCKTKVPLVHTSKGVEGEGGGGGGGRFLVRWMLCPHCA